MQHLKLFGTPMLEAEDGPLTGPAAQHHRIALLALLATAPDQTTSRDKLMGLLWPERTTDKARNSLNVSVHAIRRALGPEALLSVGDDLRLDLPLVSCDVHRFAEALESGDPRRAVDEYSGPFLEGFHLDGSAEFSQWVDRERVRWSRAYFESLETLATQATQRGDTKAAVEWWLRRSSADPLDARVLLRLMEALAAAGNRAEALRRAEAHGELLAAEVGARPNPEVDAFARSLRMAPPDADLAPSPSRPVGAGAAAASGPDPPTPPAARPRVSAGRAGVVAAALLLTLAGLASIGLDRRVEDAMVDDRIVVLPFADESGTPDLEALGGVIADWTTEGLLRAGLGEVVPTRTARRIIALLQADSIHDPITSMAHETGSGLVVWGNYRLVGDSLEVEARILDGRTGRILVAVPSVRVRPDDPMSAAQAMRERILGRLAVRLEPPLSGEGDPSQWQGLTPPTYLAYRQYIRGIELFREGRYPEAIEAYDDDADSSFLTPLLHVAFAYGNMGAATAQDSVFEILGERREDLNPFEQLRLDYGVAALRRDYPAAVAVVREELRRFPATDGEYLLALHLLGLNHPAEAVEALAAVNPARGWLRDWVPYYEVYTESLFLLGEHGRELEIARQGRERFPSLIQPVWHEARALIALNRPDEALDVLRDVETRTGRYGWTAAMAWRAAGEVLRWRGYTERARRAFDRSLQLHRSENPDDGRPAGRFGLAQLLYQAGRFEEAASVFSELAHDRPGDIGSRAHLAYIAARNGDRGTAERWDRWMEALPTDGGGDAPRVLRARATIAALLGDRARAVDLLRRGFASGLEYGQWLHTDFDLDPLRGYPPFEDLRRPKG